MFSQQWFFWRGSEVNELFDGWSQQSEGLTRAWTRLEQRRPRSREQLLEKQTQHEVKITKCQHCWTSRGLWSNYRGVRSPGERSFYQLRNNNETRSSCEHTTKPNIVNPCLETQKSKVDARRRYQYKVTYPCPISPAENSTSNELTAYLTGPAANFCISPISNSWACRWTFRSNPSGHWSMVIKKEISFRNWLNTQ